MASKGQAKPKGHAKKKGPTPYKHKNEQHRVELARLLKIARGPKYKLTKSTDLLDFVTCTGTVWAQRNKTEPGIVFQRNRPDGGLAKRISDTCKPEDKAQRVWHEGADAAGPGENLVVAVVFNDGSDEDASDDGAGAVVLAFQSVRGQHVHYPGAVLPRRNSISFAPEAMLEDLVRRRFHDAHGDAREPTA